MLKLDSDVTVSCPLEMDFLALWKTEAIDGSLVAVTVTLILRLLAALPEAVGAFVLFEAWHFHLPPAPGGAG